MKQILKIMICSVHNNNYVVKLIKILKNDTTLII